MNKLELFKKLGNTLINQGIKFLQIAFVVKTQQTTSNALRGILTSKGVPSNKIYFCDERYFYTTLQKVKDILKYDTTNDKKYVAETYDCDDFALTVRCSFREYYGLNSMGEGRMIEIKDAKSGKHIAWHRANVFFAEDNGILKPYLLEAQNDKIVEIKDINNIVIGNWRYVIALYDF